jgi:hypothetical protein
MEIRIDHLTGTEIIALISEHLQSMCEQSPPESVHALDLDRLRTPEITFWSAWEQGELLGCGALKDLGIIMVKSNPCGLLPNISGKASPLQCLRISSRKLSCKAMDG